MNKCIYYYPVIFGGCPNDCPYRWRCIDYDGGDIVVIDRRDRFGDDTKICVQRTLRFDHLRVYNSEGSFLYEIIRYRCSGNYYIRTILSGNWSPLLMTYLYPGWRISEVLHNG